LTGVSNHLTGWMNGGYPTSNRKSFLKQQSLIIVHLVRLNSAKFKLSTYSNTLLFRFFRRSCCYSRNSPLRL